MRPRLSPRVVPRPTLAMPPIVPGLDTLALHRYRNAVDADAIPEFADVCGRCLGMISRAGHCWCVERRVGVVS